MAAIGWAVRAGVLSHEILRLAILERKVMKCPRKEGG